MKNLKFLLIFLLALSFAVPSFAADSTVTGLTELSAVPASDDEFVVWDTSTVSTKKVTYSNLGAFGIGKNLLINGGMRHAQRGASGSASFTSATTPANSDDTYLLDRWILLSDGNDAADVTQQTLGGVSGQEAYIRLDVETASKKFGILQIIENKNCKSIIGSTATLSFEAKVTNATKLSDVRAVVLSWDNGIDTPTSDFVSAWAAEGTVVTPGANWTAENVAANLAVTTSWVRYKIENISIDTAGADNVAVFIYQNNVATNDTAGVFLELTNVQLEKGAVAKVYEYRDVGYELRLSQRRYVKSYLQTVVPGTSTTVGAIMIEISAVASADHSTYHHASYPVTMAAAPTVVWYSDAGDINAVTMTAGSVAVGGSYIGDYGFSLYATNGAAATERLLSFQFTAESEL